MDSPSTHPGSAADRWLGQLTWLGFLATSLIVCISLPARLTGERPALWIAAGIALFAATYVSAPRIASLLEGLLGSVRTEPVRVAAWVTVLGVFLRTVYVWSIPPVQSSDMSEYWGLATNLLQTGEYSTGTRGGVRWYAYRPPGYSFFLAGAITLFGEWKYLPAATAIALYAATQPVLFLMARAWCGPTAAVVALLLFATWPSMIAMTGLCFYEPLLIFLICLGLWLFTLAGAGSLGWAAIGGLAIGCSLLVRQTLLPAPALFLVHAIRGGKIHKRTIAATAIAGLCMMAVVIPWWRRNLGLGIPSMIATNAGQAFYQSANPDATADYNDEPGERLFQELKFDEALINRVAMERGIQWVKENPWRWIGITARKMVIFLGEDTTGFYWSVRVPFDYAGPGYAAAQLLAHAWWALVWVLAIAGAAVHRDRIRAHPELRLTIWIILLFVVTAAPFTIQPRYHIPFVPLVFLFAGLSAEAVRADSGSQGKRTIQAIQPISS